MRSLLVSLILLLSFGSVAQACRPRPACVQTQICVRTCYKICLPPMLEKATDIRLAYQAIGGFGVLPYPPRVIGGGGAVVNGGGGGGGYIPPFGFTPLPGPFGPGDFGGGGGFFPTPNPNGPNPGTPFVPGGPTDTPGPGGNPTPNPNPVPAPPGLVLAVVGGGVMIAYRRFRRGNVKSE